MSPQERLLAIALGELGQAELPGALTNPKVSGYLKASGLGPSDEIPWCSAFLAWCAAKAGLERPATSGLARSWLKVGVQVVDPIPGDIAVFTRGSPTAPTGHVGIFIARDEGRVWILGGNQGDRVSVAPHKTEDLLCYRRLLEVHAPDSV